MVHRSLQRCREDGEQGDDSDADHEGGGRARCAAGAAHGVLTGEGTGDAPEPDERRAQRAARGTGGDGTEHHDPRDRQEGAEPGTGEHPGTAADDGGEDDHDSHDGEHRPGHHAAMGGAPRLHGHVAHGGEGRHTGRVHRRHHAGEHGHDDPHDEPAHDGARLEHEPAGRKRPAEGGEGALEGGGHGHAAEQPEDRGHDADGDRLADDGAQHLAPRCADSPQQR